MKHFNKILIVGALQSHDNPEGCPLVRYLENGDAVSNFNVLQTNYDWQTGEPKTNDSGKVSKKWHRCTAWREQAEIVGRLVCGSTVMVVGKVITRYDEKNDTYRDEVTASAVMPVDDAAENTPAAFPDVNEIINLDDEEDYI